MSRVMRKNSRKQHYKVSHKVFYRVKDGKAIRRNSYDRPMREYIEAEMESKVI